MTMESIANKNQFVLQTIFKDSPKTPKYQTKRNISSNTNRRIQFSKGASLSNENSTHSYNLIEYCGNTSLNQQINNDNLSLDNQSNTDSEYSKEVNNVLGIEVKCTRQKIVFVVPEQMASFVEIMKIPFGTSSIESEQSSSSRTSSSIGPIRNRTNKNKIHGRKPYYSSKYKKNACKETYNSEPYQNTHYNIPVFNNNLYNNEPHYRASTPVITSSKKDQNQYFKKSYNKSRYTRIRKCWNCNGDSHLYSNCPLPQFQKFCRRCGNPGVITKNCRKCYRL